MQMGTLALTVMGRPERVVSFVCGAFCVWWLLFVVPFACMACMCAWRACVHGVALSLHGVLRIQSCTNIGKWNCYFLEELCKFGLVFFPMLHST